MCLIQRVSALDLRLARPVEFPQRPPRKTLLSEAFFPWVLCSILGFEAPITGASRKRYLLFQAREVWPPSLESGGEGSSVNCKSQPDLQAFRMLESRADTSC